MIDYSKPIEWHCDACGLGFDASDLGFHDGGFCSGTDDKPHPVFALVPLFRPLPTPEPSDDLPDADTVVSHAADTDGAVFIERFGDRRRKPMRDWRPDRTHRWAWRDGPRSVLGQRPDWRLCFRACGEPQLTLSIAEAVLWVVEG